MEVAIEFSISESRLSILRRSPLWKAEEDALSRDVRDQHKSSILRLIPKAIDKAEELLNCGDVKVEATVYKDLLNRVGLVSEKTIDTGSGALIRVVLDE